MDESLLKKMGLKEGMTFCAIHPTPEFQLSLKAQKIVVIVEENADFVLVFVRKKSELASLIDQGKKARKPGGKIWLAYPKADTASKPDINRDSFFKATPEFGLLINGNFAFEDNWSLLRMKDI